MSVSRNTHPQTQVAVAPCSPRQMPSDPSLLPGSALPVESLEVAESLSTHRTWPCNSKSVVSPVPLSPDSLYPPCFQMLWVSTRGSELSSGTHMLSGWVNSPPGCYLQLQRLGKEQTAADRTPRRDSHRAEAGPGLPGIPSTWTRNSLCLSGTGTGEGRNTGCLDSPGKL